VDEGADLTAAVEGARRGDPESFRILYREAQPRLLRYLTYLVGSEAEDIASETWLQATRDLGKFHGGHGDFRGWITTIARNRAMDHLRRASLHPPAVPVPVEDLAFVAGREDTEDRAIEAITTQEALSLIASLPPDQAEAVLLRAVVGLDAKRAAQVVGKRAGAIRTAAYRGLKNIEKRIERRPDRADLPRPRPRVSEAGTGLLKECSKLPGIVIRRSYSQRVRTTWAVRVPWPLLAVLAVQAALSASMVRSRTAFGDEALYLSAGHLEWSHWLHGTQVPAYQTWFSGAPVIYPPIGAIADSLGGLAAARLLSLVFMLGVTSFVWATATRLLEDNRAAFFAAALFAALAPTLHLGSYATYDAPALLLLAAATWCAAGARGGPRAARWIIAAGILLALANATKYATALYDPTVLGVTILSSWPDAGRKTALRRAAFLAGTAAVVLAVLLALGGPGYLTGIRVTTTGRDHGTDTAALVFADAWSWTAVVLVPAVAGAVVCAVRRRWPQALLLAVLALSALLAPADQARIQTTTSLNKHVDFGAWFAAIAAGYLLSILSRRRLVLAASLAALIPVTSVGVAQAQTMIDWPDVTGLVKVVRPMTNHGGHFLVETTDVLQYYLPKTTWRQWSSTANNNLTYYQQAIARHYFAVVVLSFNNTLAADYAIAFDLSASGGYTLAAKVRSGQTVFYVWDYTGRV
jgi:RNA polymerase sigma factor (sigma-70 family)